VLVSPTCGTHAPSPLTPRARSFGHRLSVRPVLNLAFASELFFRVRRTPGPRGWLGCFSPSATSAGVANQPPQTSTARIYMVNAPPLNPSGRREPSRKLMASRREQGVAGACYVGPGPSGVKIITSDVVTPKFLADPRASPPCSTPWAGVIAVRLSMSTLHPCSQQHMHRVALSNLVLSLGVG
jgi:hypothetical protein